MVGFWSRVTIRGVPGLNVLYFIVYLVLERLYGSVGKGANGLVHVITLHKLAGSNLHNCNIFDNNESVINVK